jgi:hypothetical protein
MEERHGYRMFVIGSLLIVRTRRPLSMIGATCIFRSFQSYEDE